MTLRALGLVAGLVLASNAQAVALELVDTHYLGAFDGNELYGEFFTLADSGAIDHALTFDITGALYAGSGILDLSLGNITNITGLTATIFKSGVVGAYATFTPVLGGDLLILPLGTYFGVGDYTLQVKGQATGSGAFGLPHGAYTIGAATLPVPEPEAWAMLLAGLGLVGLRARYKANKAGGAHA